MTHQGYFSRKNTSGAHASNGFQYQDYIALYATISYLDDADFLGIGIETHDDFVLSFSDDKEIKVQVKNQNIGMPLVHKLISENQVLVASRMDNNVASFRKLLIQFRNNKDSFESSQLKLEVKKDFEDSLKKYFPDGISEVPDSWNLDVVSDEKVDEIVLFKCINFVSKYRADFQFQSCFDQLMTKIAKKRSDRGYISKEEILGDFDHYSVAKQEKEQLSESLKKYKATSAYELGIPPEKILDAIRKQLEQAETSLLSGNFNIAEAIYSKLAQNLDTAELYAKCARIQVIQEKYNEAQRYCNKAFAIDSKLPELLIVQALIKTKYTKYEEAIRLLKSAGVIDNSLPEIYFNLGVNYIQLKNITKAIASFEKCITLDENNSYTYLNLGICQHDEKLYDEALVSLDKCLLLDPQEPNALSEKGKIKRYFGFFEESISLFENCLELDPNNKIAKQELAFGKLALGDPIGAGFLIECFEEHVNKLSIGESLSVVDMGYHQTPTYLITNLDDDFLSFEFDSFRMKIAVPAKNMIGVGVLYKPLGLDGFDVKPVIMKDYEKKAHYLSMCKTIGDLVSDQSPFPISGYLMDKLEYCEVRIKLDCGDIWGETLKSETLRFREFIDSYDDEFLLLLTNSTTNQKSEFLLSGLEIK